MHSFDQLVVPTQETNYNLIAHLNEKNYNPTPFIKHHFLTTNQDPTYQSFNDKGISDEFDMIRDIQERI